jgi:hypothetical protein
MTRQSTYATTILLLAAGISTLAGCTPAPPPQQFTPPPQASWTPSPSPTPPDGAPFGWRPDWTEAQTAAAQTVDTLREWLNEVSRNSESADLLQWTDLTIEPAYSWFLNWHLGLRIDGIYATGSVVPVQRAVSPETLTEDGHRQVIVTQREDNSGMEVYTADGQPGGYRDSECLVRSYSVQWVDGPDTWRIALMNEEGTC